VCGNDSLQDRSLTDRGGASHDNNSSTLNLVWSVNDLSKLPSKRHLLAHPKAP
jgi:hypothetical protein